MTPPRLRYRFVASASSAAHAVVSFAYTVRRYLDPYVRLVYILTVGNAGIFYLSIVVRSYLVTTQVLLSDVMLDSVAGSR